MNLKSKQYKKKEKQAFYVTNSKITSSLIEVQYDCDKIILLSKVFHNYLQLLYREVCTHFSVCSVCFVGKIGSGN